MLHAKRTCTFSASNQRTREFCTILVHKTNQYFPFLEVWTRLEKFEDLFWRVKSEYSSKTVENSNFTYCSGELPNQGLETLSALKKHSNFSKLTETLKNEQNTFVLTTNTPKSLLFCWVVAENGNIPSSAFAYLFYSTVAVFLVF